MPKDIFTKIACVFTIFVFLGNDVMASVSALRHMESINQQLEANAKAIELEKTDTNNTNTKSTKSNSTNNLVVNHPSIPTEVVDVPDVFVNQAEAKTAFIGAHAKDPLNSPADNIFQIDLEDQIKNYQYVYLHYNTKGLANPEDLPKSINQKEVYVGDQLREDDSWHKATVMLDYEDLTQGVNNIRFSAPNSTSLSVEVKGVELQLTNSPRNFGKNLKLKREKVNTQDFQLKRTSKNTSQESLIFKNKDIEMASVPKSIRNITRNGWGYGIRNNKEEEVKILIGIDAKRLTKPSDIKEAKIFYFDNTTKTWKKTHTEKVDMANAILEASVPPNTDYFAGLIKSPDMPEASGFMPTAISDIEAANPAAGMNLITPPSQSRTGEANVSYPLSIPQGRKGLTPPLAMNYSSDGGTGWLGVGWNLSTPSISIDTRWGVPTFDPDFQEEVYLLNGSSLIQEGGTKGNRAKVNGSTVTLSPRKDGSVKFFERTMSSYKEIERIGDDPTEYRWVITLANKTKYYYGTDDGSSALATKVLADGNGNIVKWYLAKVQDQWGNEIHYNYAQSTYSGNSNAFKNGAKTMILDNIKYTGHNGTPGKYEVKFIATAGRVDATISMKYGFKVLDDHLLTRVEVKYNSAMVKSFDMSYGQDQFFKKKLIEITENGKNGNEFYSHTFDYYDKPLSYSPVQEFDVDHFSSNLYNNFDGELSWLRKSLRNITLPSPIKTTSSFGWSVNGGFGIGIIPEGTQWLFKLKSMTFGGNIGYSQTNSRDRLSLQDMNGDGLPDIVYDRKGGRGFFALENGTSGLKLGPFVSINNTDRLFRTKNYATNYGFDFTIMDKAYYYGSNWSSGNTVTENFLTDYNADGYVDLIVRDGDGKAKIKFGQTSNTGEFEFANNSASSANPIIKGEDLPAVSPDDIIKDIEIVKSWVAPFTGTIDISGTAESLGTLDGETRVAVQKGNNLHVHNFRIVDENSSVSTNYTNVSVTKGEMILFRAKSAADGQQDLLTWNPSIEYTNISYTDGNGIDYTHSAYEDAFLLSGSQNLVMKGDQQIKVALNRSVANPLTDDLVFKMRIVELNSDGDVVNNWLYANTLDEGSTSFANDVFDRVGSSTISMNLGSPSGISIPGSSNTNSYDIYFSLFSTSNVDWRDVKFRPVVTIIGADNCNTEHTYYPTIAYETYNKVETMNSLFIPQTGYDSELDYRIIPSFSYTSGDVDDVFTNFLGGSNQAVAYMTVKDGTNLHSKMKIVIDESLGTVQFYTCDALGKTGSAINASTLPATYSLNNPDFTNGMYVEFFVDNDEIGEVVTSFIVNHLDEFVLEEYDGGWTGVDQNNENYNIFYKKNEYVGDRILHWGQLAWSYAPSIAENTPILISDMIPAHEAIASDQGNGFDDENGPDQNFFDENQDDLNPINQKFFVLGAQRGEIDYMLRSYQKGSYTDILAGNYQSPTVANSTENLDRYSFMGTHMAVYASSGMSSPGKLGETEIEPLSGVAGIPNSIYGANGTALIYKSYTHSHTATGSLNGHSSVGLSKTTDNENEYYSKAMVQFQDYNGDGYPDLLVDDGTDIQSNLTNPIGGHRAQSSNPITSDDLSKSTTKGSTATYSHNFVNDDNRFTKKPQPGANASVSISNGENVIGNIDLNGDGLPDHLVKTGANTISMGYGTGKGFEAQIPVTASNIGYPEGWSYNYNIGGNLSKLQDGFTNNMGGSTSGGLTVNKIDNLSKSTFIDINGDGLKDCIIMDGEDADLYINTGTSWVEYGNNPKKWDQKLNKTNGFGFALNGKKSHTFPLGKLFGAQIKGNVSGGGSINAAINSLNSSLMDVNGDGVVDYVTEGDYGSLEVRYAQLQEHNLLKKVTNPLGGSFTITYERVGNKTGYYEPTIKTHLNDQHKVVWDMPSSKWVMSELTIDDGLDVVHSNNDIDGDDQIKTYFSYEGGIHSRREREFLGFTRTEKKYAPSTTDNDRNDNQTTFAAQAAKIDFPKIYITEVNQYMAPTRNEFEYRKRSEYVKNVLTASYTYYNKLDVVENEPPFTFTHDIYPVAVKLYNYEFKNVCIDPAHGSFNELYDFNTSPSAVDWETITETQSVFPALTSFQNVSYNDVVTVPNRNKYFSQKFTITYDELWNVIQYENEGKMVGRTSGTRLVESYTRNYYDYIIEEKDLNDPSVTHDLALSDDEFDAYRVTCNTDATYSEDIIYIPKAADPCYGFTNLPPNLIADPIPITSRHKKLLSEDIQLWEPTYTDQYQDKLIATMEYFQASQANGQTGMLKVHKIYENAISAANLRRHSEVATLDNGKAPSSIWNHLTTSDKAVTDITYDSYGNPKTVTGPANQTNQRMVITLTYDTDVNQFVTQVSNSFGESSCSNYDISTGNLRKSVDVNGHAMRYVYDNFYRLIQVWAPRQLYDDNAEPTISFAYYPSGINPNGTANDKIPVAITDHNLDETKASDPSLTPKSDCNTLATLSTRTQTISSPLQTATFVDGLSRVVQVKKDASAKDGSNLSNIRKRQVSPWAYYDQWAEVVSQSNVILEASTTSIGRLSVFDSHIMSTKDYDYLGRPTGDEAVVGVDNGSTTYDFLNTTYTYGWETLGGEEYSKAEVSSGIGTQVTFKDSRGFTAVSRQSGGQTNQDTEFSYDALGQLLQSENPLGETTDYTYDFFGRTTQEDHPDRGITSWTYDMAGNILTQTTPLTINGPISFTYNYTRLTGKKMSNGIDEIYDVTYNYGGGTNANSAGRISSVVQGTNFKTENYKYDELGNLIYEQKVINIPQAGTKIYLTEYDFDSWGRILEMVYPDQETVTYDYNDFGDLESIYSQRVNQATTSSIIDNIVYNGYGNIQHMRYGNGAGTDFTYDPITRNSETVMQLAKDSPNASTSEAYTQSFSYDVSGRIDGMDHQLPGSPFTGLVNYNYNYDYDGFNRLESTDGDIDGEAFQMDLTYNTAGGILTKSQSLGNDSYNHGYVYDTQNKHQLSSVGGKTFDYNDAGSIETITENSQTTTFSWNEDQWLTGVDNPAGYHHYVYDHNGDRIMKSSLTAAATANNGQNNPGLIDLDPYALYVNPYYIATTFSDNEDVSKHYFMGSQRVASERVVWGEEPIGQGEGESSGGVGDSGSTGLQQNLDGTLKTNPVLKDLSKVLAKFGLEEGKDFSLNDMKQLPSIENYYQIPDSIASPGASPETGEGGDPENEYSPVSRLRYWYHPNYLGNIDMVTDENGEVHQYFVYSPFGENMYEYTKSTDFNSWWRFNGKEEDPETGNQYYGARYYDPKVSVWLSVDPLAHDFPRVTPYNFVGNNPIHFVDPDGRFRWPVGQYKAYAKMYPAITRYLKHHAENDFMNGKVFGRAPVKSAQRVARNHGGREVSKHEIRKIVKWGEGSMVIETSDQINHYNPDKETFENLDLDAPGMEQVKLVLDGNGERVVLNTEEMKEIERVLSSSESTAEQKQAAAIELFRLLGHEGLGHKMDYLDGKADVEAGYEWETYTFRINPQKNTVDGKTEIIYQQSSNIDEILKALTRRNTLYNANETTPTIP